MLPRISKKPFHALPLDMQRMKDGVWDHFWSKLTSRFWSHVDRRSDDECWEWTATKRYEYGFLRVWELPGHPEIRAHRISWWLTRGAIPENTYVLHACDNPGCVNPNHLSLGSAADNAQDMVRKGRHGSKRGEKNHFTRLKEDEVKEIRRLTLAGVSVHELAEQFGVSKSCIYMIRQGHNWKHVA